MKTIENLAIKSTVLVMMALRRPDVPPGSISCWNDNPVIYMRYDGTSGRTHGDTNDSSPAKKAVIKEVWEKPSSIWSLRGKGWNRVPPFSFSRSALTQTLEIARCRAS